MTSAKYLSIFPKSLVDMFPTYWFYKKDIKRQVLCRVLWIINIFCGSAGKWTWYLLEMALTFLLGACWRRLRTVWSIHRLVGTF